MFVQLEIATIRVITILIVLKDRLHLVELEVTETIEVIHRAEVVLEIILALQEVAPLLDQETIRLVEALREATLHRHEAEVILVEVALEVHLAEAILVQEDNNQIQILKKLNIK